MAKRKSFEAILDQEFRWPTKGDTPVQDSFTERCFVLDVAGTFQRTTWVLREASFIVLQLIIAINCKADVRFSLTSFGPLPDFGIARSPASHAAAPRSLLAPQAQAAPSRGTRP